MWLVRIGGAKGEWRFLLLVDAIGIGFHSLYLCTRSVLFFSLSLASIRALGLFGWHLYLFFQSNVFLLAMAKALAREEQNKNFELQKCV